ncbi:MAG: 4-hydroxy-tetrahydrodipicolinate reductase, partial [Bacteroidales bacterium]|nr:4-hydroxy-tetrahydrodipicolinate reductase [Bacteroidales bacterium]
MKIALIGYGKMGKSIERIAKARQHQIVEIIEIDEIEKINLDLAAKCDLTIE